MVFVNDYQDFGAEWQKVQYRKDAFGRVHVRGLCKRASASSLHMFQLPVGYRPSKYLMFWVNGQNEGARLDVTADGIFTISQAQAAAWYEFISVNVSFEAS